MQTNIEITDHALVRYMERVHGMDFEHYRKCIRHEIDGQERYNGTCYVGGFSFLFLEGKLVTVVKGRYNKRQIIDGRMT